MVVAGSVVSCGSVLPDADACGVAFRVAMDARGNVNVREFARRHHEHDTFQEYLDVFAAATTSR